jgi:2-polyprenyl-3-methyl-5-hydroxy-6-metoxy-1,4-benzoquinol methylase
MSTSVPSAADPKPSHDARYFKLSAEQIDELKDYIIHREKALDRDLLPYGDPAGKDVLVFGCGFGNEVLWAARHGARSIVAVDMSAALSPVPFQSAMREVGITYEPYVSPTDLSVVSIGCELCFEENL